jgi:probable HAF family extracellular repeat protein
MNSKIWTHIMALTLFAALASPSHLVAQGAQAPHHHYHHYQLIDVRTFGGPESFLSSGFDISTASGVMNQKGALVGWADTSMPDPFPNSCFTTDCYLAYGFRLQNGVRTDLGVLVDGFNSAADGGINDGGLIAGTAENGETDPLIPGFPELRSVLWENGVIRDLGTLPGGYESYSSAINNRGQVVGVAENAIPDANSMSFPGYQARAFLWDRRHGMQDLGALSGGNDAIAAMINEPGQVVGWSYTSSTASTNCPDGFSLTTGSFVWEKKKGMTDLGSFGGTCTLATDLNNQRQVVGNSNLTGDQSWHAFVWDHATGITDLGTLGGNFSSAWAINEKGEVVGGATNQGDLQTDAVLWRENAGKWHGTDLGTVSGSNCSFAVSINATAQVVGISGTNCALAFLWEEGGPMVDLNTLVSSSSGINVQGVATINDHGEIAAGGTDANGNGHAVLLIPCDENHAGVEGCDYSLLDADAAARENPAPAIQKPTTAAPRVNNVGRMRRRRLGSLSRMPIPMASLADNQDTPSPRESEWQLEENVEFFGHAEPSADSSSKSSCDLAQPPQCCIRIGRPCFGRGGAHCCPAPFPHHSFCSSRTARGRCLMN